MVKLAPKNYYADENGRLIEIVTVTTNTVTFNYHGEKRVIGIPRTQADKNIADNLWIYKAPPPVTTVTWVDTPSK